MEAQTEQKKPIKDVKEIVVAAAKTYKAIHDAKENDGKIDFKDIPLFLSVFPYYIPAIDNAIEVPAQLGDMDAEEAADLIATVSSELAVIDEHAKQIIQAVLEAIPANIKVVKAIKG